MKKFYILLILLCYSIISQSRIHELRIQDDYRTYIKLTTFGFYERGNLTVQLINFSYKPAKNNLLFGFTLEKVLNSAMDSLVETQRDTCVLYDASKTLPRNLDLIYFEMDLINKQLKINCSTNSTMGHLKIYGSSKSDSKYLNGLSCFNSTLPITSHQNLYEILFVILIPTEQEEGLYELFFHNCANYEEAQVATSFSINITERNLNNYLSAGEMPLPTLYFLLSAMFFLSALFWLYILKKSRHPVFKIHYLMGVLVVIKSLGLLFHGMNYYCIQSKGEHVTTWAVLYYVTHLLKGSVLFITIILIGTGWTFIKHILSPKDKKIFMIVIPLQVFASIAEIIIEESEEGDIEYKRWLDVFTYVDLICCFAILFPIKWSVKHLQDASQTDGKAAINLRKLKLFRHFYILVLCYIYFARMIVYLLKMSVPFKYDWFDEMFKETATFIFFILTGYKFRPESANPYFQVDYNDDDDDEDVDIVVNQYSFVEGLTKLNRISNEQGEEDKDSLLINKRESSHDYD